MHLLLPADSVPWRRREQRAVAALIEAHHIIFPMKSKLYRLSIKRLKLDSVNYQKYFFLNETDVIEPHQPERTHLSAECHFQTREGLGRRKSLPSLEPTSCVV